ncbi:MAG: DUF368 domain-containing protein [Methanomicrobiales archaeon]|nr:DUF368 domain-containing protein [Methanomicrobiales archaeon]
MNIVSLIREYLPVVAKGVLMGICDIIPGVSGGTIAFITGIYSRLISAIAHISPLFIRDLICWDVPSMKTRLEEMDIIFLITLAVGIGSAFLLISRIILFLLNTYPVQTNGFFLGLILASSILLFAPLPRRYLGGFVFLFIGIIIGLGIVMANPQALGHSYPILFITGFIALCAMILPGISGAYITLLFNQYEFMLDAIRTLSLMDIGVYLTGGVIGILTFTRLLKYLLKYYHDMIIAFLTGLMLGTSKLLFDRATVSVPAGPDLLVFIVLGILVVGLFQVVQTRMSR